MNTGRRIQVEVIQDVLALTGCRADWDGGVASFKGDIYFTVDWIVTWYQHFGAEREFLGYRLTDEYGELVGVLAVVIEEFGWGRFSVRLARLAGMDQNYAITGLPFRADWGVDALRVVFEDLFSKRSCSGFSLSPISNDAEGVADVRRAARGANCCVILDEERRQHTMMYLPLRKEDYWSGLSKSRQKEIRRSKNKMRKEYTLYHETSCPDDIEEFFDEFVSQHTQQWRAVGKAGHFGDWEGSYAYYRDLVVRLSPLRRAFIEKHLGDEEILSSRLTFVFGDRAYWRLTARTLDQDAVKMGVGKVGLVERIEKLIDQGTAMIEAGAGEYDYKLSYGGQLVPLRQVIVGRASEKLRMNLLLTAVNLLDLFYYRLWFLKLSPYWRRLTGLGPKPLWKVWIRTRL